MKLKYFTGIGSRETPREILDIMRKVSKRLVLEGYVLRSGGADGADSAFAYGWEDAYEENKDVLHADIFIPWNGFNDLWDGQNNVRLVKDRAIIQDAHALLKDIHPAFNKLTKGPLALHTRNCFQVLGGTLASPSSIVVCYAKVDDAGRTLGGTATAVHLAQKRGIPVRNLYLPEDFNKVLKYLEKE